MSNRWFGLAAVVAAACAWAFSLVAPQLDTPGYDLSAIVVGGKLVADGQVAALYSHDPVYYNLANGEAFVRAAHELGFTGGAPTAFVHAPLVAWMAQPLTRMPFQSVVHVWLVLSAFALAGVLWLSLDAFAPTWRTLPVLAAVMFAMLPFEPVRYSFWLAQTTPWIVVMMLGALALLRRDRLVLAGLLMAVPAFIKLTPLVFALLWLWQRRWPALWGLCGGLCALSLVSVATMGLACNLTYVGRVADIGRIALVAFNNHSMSAFLMRFQVPHEEIERFTMFHPSMPIRAVVLAVAAAMVAVPAWALARRRMDPLAEAFAMLMTLLVPSIAWTHYFLLLVPLALLVCARVEVPRWRGLSIASSMIALLLCMRPLAPDESHFTEHRGLVIVGPTLAAVLMLVVLSSLALRSRTRR